MRGVSYSTLCITFFLLAQILFVKGAENTDKCKYCSLLVDTFLTGMKKTENQHFAGGNTDWEERKLGKFARSETRLVEIMEHICKLKNSNKEYTGVKDIEFKCQQLAEEHEEDLENWYFHKQSSDPDLLNWLCFEKLRLCCLEGHYGPDCKPCPGVDKKLPACFGHGKCHGVGSREGTGKCKCDKGYVGLMCSNCDSNYFAVQQTSTSLECKECHRSCKGGCSGEGPATCKECRSGWIYNESEGCKDVDECLEEGRCVEEHSLCINTEGSYHCGCESGFVKEADGKCKPDIQAPPPTVWIRPEALLRGLSVSALCILLTAVVWRRSIPLAIFAAICVLLAIYIEFRLDHSIISY